MTEPEQSESFATPITLAVIADTHFGSLRLRLPDEVLRILASADLILHAGDFCSVEAFDMLSAIGELRGVAGNNDVDELYRRLPAKRVFDFGGFRAAMFHGHGFGRLTAREAAESELAGTYDLGIFGHSHQPYSETHNGTLLFNPGSPTNRRTQPQHSYGIIRIDDRIDANLHFLP